MTGARSAAGELRQGEGGVTPAPPRAVAILGLGLIGGSLARDLLSRGVEVRGYDRDEATMRDAAGAGVRPLARLDASALAGLDLIVLALPVTTASRMLLDIAPHVEEGCAVTDLGSTKRSITRAAANAGLGQAFVGSHPVAGDHRSGWSAGRSGLFLDAVVYLTPAPDAAAFARHTVRDLWLAVGAHPEEIGAEEHDLRFAWISHLPQIAASALAAALDEGGWPSTLLGPGGRDATRLAGSSPEMWEAICRDNADALDPALEALEHEIGAFRAALRLGDDRAIRDLLVRARRWALPVERTS